MKKEPKENWKDRIFVDFYRNDDLTSIFLIVTIFFRLRTINGRNRGMLQNKGKF